MGIDMPMMHRLSCFRDDIIFIIYCYQRWAYRVDKNRPSAWVDPDEQQKGELEGDKAETKELADDATNPTKAEEPEGESKGEQEATAKEEAATETAEEKTGEAKKEAGAEGLRQRK